MTPLAETAEVGFTLLLSAAISVLVPGLITLIVKLVEIRSKKKTEKATAKKTDAEAKKTEAEGTSVEADVFTKALEGQGSVVDQLLKENQRAYARAKEAEESATAANKTAKAAQDDARTAREEVAALTKRLDREIRARMESEARIEAYLGSHQIGLPDWWPRHDSDGSAEQG